ncbi:hypothetical protein OPQ81_011799 [Rhizoctonia solani]|nr:hypothetical protein OPQ81_011799 [Rhizoctonia solani]
MTVDASLADHDNWLKTGALLSMASVTKRSQPQQPSPDDGNESAMAKHQCAHPVNGAILSVPIPLQWINAGHHRKPMWPLWKPESPSSNKSSRTRNQTIDPAHPRPQTHRPPSSPILTPQSLIPSLTDDPTTVIGNTKDADEFDLGMDGYEVLISLQVEHKLLAQFWDWQRMHLPYVAPVPFLSAYAIHSELVHPGEPIPSPPPPPPAPFSATALDVPPASTVQPTPDLAQYISPLLLYSVFAIAALFHGDPETAHMFYERARGMVFTEVAHPKVATVQAMCLMSTWELGHARSPASWTLIGVALSLCIRLGMNTDATPLLQTGAISQRLFDTRNFVFWAVFNSDRFHATCMGMRPLIDRRIISTPKHSSPTADTIESRKPTTSQESTTWWSPSSLGMGDVLIQAAWDAVRELLQMMDDLFDSVYATDAPTRTPQEILQLVAKNHLTVQKFIDNLPTWLRSTGAIRRKESGLVYLHLFIHLTSILTNRPFLSSHHPHSDTTRAYRTLAFRIARASALQVSSLIRHIPLSSPCVTMPYIVYSACTVLLLAPEDPAAMDAVRTGLACLDEIDQTGYWVDSARDAASRVRGPRRTRGPSPVPGESESEPSTTRPNTSDGSGAPHIPTAVDAPSGFGVPAVVIFDEDVNAIDQVSQVAPPFHEGVTRDAQGYLPSDHTRLAYIPPSLGYTPKSTAYHPYKRPKQSLPHVAYATSHADPQHSMPVPYTHWHTGPSACTDVGTCFTWTVEHGGDPAFVDRVGDPYEGVPVDWSSVLAGGLVQGFGEPFATGMSF